MGKWGIKCINIDASGGCMCVSLAWFNSAAKLSLSVPCADIHTEAVQAALAKHKEQKMALPMPTKRRSTFVQSPADACTPPGEVLAVWGVFGDQQ